MSKLIPSSGIISALDFCETPTLSRRAMLTGSGALFAWGFAPKFAHAASGRDPRLITIILRGAMDGLSAVAPLGDPDYASLRGAIALTKDGANPALPLDGFFALHPAMPNFARLYQSGQALVVHASATPYRARSHFDGQDVLESGMPDAGHTDSGWMNRVLANLPKGEKINPNNAGISIDVITPLIMRGNVPVLGWAPPNLPKASDDLAARLLALYQAKDAALAQTLAHGLNTEDIANKANMTDGSLKARGGEIEQMKISATGAARLLAKDDGPRLAALAFGGWDTHANEGGANGRLAQLLGGLDVALASFEQNMAPVWNDTTILIVTEFGRTAKINGTTGTDHGTATVAFLVGGAVKGGRAVTDWPGLKMANLYEARDLKPTTDLRAVVKGVLTEQLGMSKAVLAGKVFPGSDGVAPMLGLTRV